MRHLLHQLVQQEGMQAETFDCASSFLERCEPGMRGCLILDIQMPGTDGLELYERLRARRVHLPTILITAHADLPTAIRAVRLGVCDFVEKPIDHDLMIQCVHRALARDTTHPIDPEYRHLVLQRIEKLSPRERQVMEMIVWGRLNKQIAKDLDLSMKTIEKHRGNVMRKMEADGLAELVRMAIVAGVA